MKKKKKITTFKLLFFSLLFFFILGLFTGLIIILTNENPEQFFFISTYNYTFFQHSCLFILLKGLEFLIYGLSGLLAVFIIIFLFKLKIAIQTGLILLAFLGGGLFYIAFFEKPKKTDSLTGHMIVFSIMGVVCLFLAIFAFIRLYRNKSINHGEKK